MSLMQEWAKLFPDARPRSNDNAAAGSSTDFSNFDAQLSPFRGSDGWQYDNWNEDEMYPLKGGGSQLGYFAASLSPHWTDRGEGIDNVVKNTADMVGSFDSRTLYQKKRTLKKLIKYSGDTKTVRGTWRAMSYKQIWSGHKNAEAGLKEYDSISLDEFKDL